MKKEIILGVTSLAISIIAFIISLYRLFNL